MAPWTRVTDPEAAAALLPAWFAARMMATRGTYGFLLATGDVLRVSRVTAIHVAPGSGPVLIDVLLDHAGVPGGVDLAWRPKQFLGAPLPGAALATLNLAQIVAVVEFAVAEFVETANDTGTSEANALPLDLSTVIDPGVANDDAERVA